MAPSKTLAVPDSLTVTDKEGYPYWDGDDIHLPLFMDVLDRHLQKEHADIHAYLLTGFDLSRNPHGRVR